ncbi:MAG: hypothetical protein M3R17_03585 [Bacteroidota bacterium]|nr:hypothetical protein [Bacteroidota bacterium]
METLPIYIPLVFAFTAILSVLLFFKATNYSRPAFYILLSWLLLQSIISLTGFYTVTNTFPPRFLLLIGPPLLFIVFLFATKKGRIFIDSLDIKTLTLLHIVRIPVELVLFWLFLHKAVPQLMTFEGRNFDILSGISAPFIYYFGFVRPKMNRKIILLWNFICLGLLLNIVIHAVLSAPFPFQKFAFDQPNIAVLYFPFVWLPCCIVPLALLSHLISIRQLLKKDITH